MLPGCLSLTNDFMQRKLQDVCGVAALEQTRYQFGKSPRMNANAKPVDKIADIRAKNMCISQNVSFFFFFAIHISIKYIDNKNAMGALHRILCLPGLRKHRLGW